MSVAHRDVILGIETRQGGMHATIYLRSEDRLIFGTDKHIPCVRRRAATF